MIRDKVKGKISAFSSTLPANKKHKIDLLFDEYLRFCYLIPKNEITSFQA